MNTFVKIISKYPWWIMAGILALTVYFFIEMSENSEMETDLDEYMPQDHPAFVYSDSAEAIFNIKDGIIIAIENKNGIYNAVTLDKIKRLTKDLQKMKQINKNEVTSLYEAENIVGSEYGLDVTSFYDKVPQSKEKLEEIQKNVRSNEMVYKRIVSEDETVSVVIAEIADDVFSMEFYHEILDLAKSYEDGQHKLYVAGTPIVEGTLAYLGPKDMKKMVPIVILVIIIVLYITLRNTKTTFLTLMVVLLSVIWAFGLMAALGIPIYSVTTMMPVMLIAIGVADGIHLFNHMSLFLKENPDANRREAIKDMLKNMWKPVVMTSVTTSVGFISLLTSEVYPIKYFGLFTAFGVLSAMFFSLVFIPAGVIIFDKPKNIRKSNDSNNHHPLAEKLAQWVIHNKLTVIIISLLIMGLGIYGTQKVWINSSFLDKFERDSDIVQTDKFINEKFGGTTTLNVILSADRKDAFKEPKVLKMMSTMQQDVVSSLDLVGNSFSLSDYLERMNKVMHADNEAYNTIPDSQDLNAQYLLLYEMSGDPDNLWEVVNYDYNTANLTLQIKQDDTKSLKAALNAVKKYEAEFNHMGIQIDFAGSGYTSLVFTDLILEGQVKSLILSLIIIIILLSLMFRQVSIGFIGAVPISITAILSFGVMGLLNIPLSTTTALMASIAIGIGIDFAVHFIERYRISQKSYSDKLQVANATMDHSGRAILFNAVVVIAGFMVLLFSVFPPNRALGALVSFNMFTSFAGTITIMLVLLHWKKKFK
jgi:hypothetical protein